MIYPVEDMEIAVELLTLLKENNISFFMFCLFPGHEDISFNKELNNAISEMPLLFKS